MQPSDTYIIPLINFEALAKAVANTNHSFKDFGIKVVSICIETSTMTTASTPTLKLIDILVTDMDGRSDCGGGKRTCRSRNSSMKEEIQDESTF